MTALRFIIGCLGALWTGFGCAATTQNDTPGDPLFEEGEQLLAQPPAGWRRTTSTAGGILRLAHFVAPGEDEEDWTTRISFESTADVSGPDPLEFIDLIAGDLRRNCAELEKFNTFSGFENGYPTSVALLSCPLNKDTDKPEISMIKAIQGNDYFYTVSRTRRSAAEVEPLLSETEVAAWSIYMRSVGVCDSLNKEHPCPISAPEDQQPVD